METITQNTQKINPCLWFNVNAEEVVNFYISVFKNSKIDILTRYGKNAPLPEGTVLTIAFQLDGQHFLALNGGPEFTFSEAISFIINCDNQEELDYFWSKLSEGGREVQCGWLKDQFGLSWQIVPTRLAELMKSGDTEKSGRVMQALMQMVKIDIAGLQAAFDQ
jgi:predicted 3-demethylubiquinone-9 3-methyltransferase (glyoxalase superfamily)